MIGWLVYTAAKPIAKRALRSKAKGAVPRRRSGSRKPNAAALVAGAGALLGGLLFWRNRRDDDGPGSDG